MDKKQQILRKLKESRGYLSGQQLSEALGVSRTAVWKIIRKLKQDGYPIEAVTNKGYRLLSVEDRDDGPGIPFSIRRRQGRRTMTFSRWQTRDFLMERSH